MIVLVEMFESENHFHKISILFEMFHQIFFPPQGKRCATVTYKYDI